MTNDLFYLDDEQRAIRDLAREIARERIAPLAARVDETEEYPTEQIQRLGAQGLMGLHIPEEYGGSDAGALAFCLAAVSNCLSGQPTITGIPVPSAR